VGLPAADIMKGMENQCCHSGTAHQEFNPSNYSSTRTTAAREFEFVVRPDLNLEYPGGRKAVLPEVFLFACGAARAKGGERLDMPLDEIPARYQDAEFGANMLDSVKFVAAQKAKEAFLTKEALESTAEKLKAGKSKVDHVRVLEQLALQGTNRLQEVKKTLGKALKNCRERVRLPSTGGSSFKVLANEVSGVLSGNELEVLVEVARANLCEAKLCEEEVVGLRLYTGPSYVFINASLRKTSPVTDHSNVTHAICSGLTNLSRVSSIPESRKLYRGVAGMKLPECFWKRDAFGAKGGVDRAFLSLTTQKPVAIQYLGKGHEKLPTLFEVECSAVDKGACLSWLSQYPEEDEVSPSTLLLFLMMCMSH
jgi:hypothetical protein